MMGDQLNGDIIHIDAQIVCGGFYFFLNVRCKMTVYVFHELLFRNCSEDTAERRGQDGVEKNITSDNEKRTPRESGAINWSRKT